MHPDVVVDVGNSRIKWGRCSMASVGDIASLPADDAAAWQKQFADWRLTSGMSWAVSGVAPARRDALVAWLEKERQQVRVLDSARQLPLTINVEHPDRVGLDRLLNAVAVNARREPGRAAVIVDAGSAVTVDWVDKAGAFAGGAIFPGLRLMAQALHNYTALLPLVEVGGSPPLPATTTRSAIEAGVFWAVIGGIRSLVEQMTTGRDRRAIFLAGGDGELLMPALGLPAILWPQMTLEGIRLASQAMGGDGPRSPSAPR